MNDLEKKFPILIKIPLLWGQMDAFQHLNNVIYFRFFETARIAYFEKIGFLKFMDDKGIGPILASTSCKYIKPMVYPDTAFVGAKVTDVKEDRFLMEYVIKSKNKDSLVAIGEANVVCYDYELNKKANLPKEIKKRILDLEKNFLKNDSH